MQGKRLPHGFEICLVFFLSVLHIHLDAVVTLGISSLPPPRVGAERGAVQERLQGSAGGEGARGEGADAGTLHAQTERSRLHRVGGEESPLDSLDSPVRDPLCGSFIMEASRTVHRSTAAAPTWTKWRFAKGAHNV